MFIDRAKIKIKSSNGGNGIVSFLMFRGGIKAGPDGGDGGKGGDVIVVGDPSVTSLLDFHYKTKYYAENGKSGGSKNCTGRSGEDVVIKVPFGTVCKDAESGRVICEILEEKDKAVILKGGKGGKGNARFSNSKRHAPSFSQSGEVTEFKFVTLELKVIADVGIIGFPNVGKSTLLSKLTKAKPKIANYHFTTLSPNLGVINIYDEQFVLADIPGIIEGASSGAGLGLEFLKHVERTRMLIHVVDVSKIEGREPIDDFKKINLELSSYSQKLKKLPQIIVANKMDFYGADENLKELKKKIRGKKIFGISALTSEGLEELIKELYAVMKTLPPREREVYPEFSYDTVDSDDFEVKLLSPGVYEVTGGLVKKLERNITLTSAHSMAYFQKVLKEKGVIKKLNELGVVDGDTVIVGNVDFEFLN